MSTDHAVTENPDVLLQARGLVRRFGSRRAVDNVSLELSQGDCVALFGPNGAGKTTLLRMLGGLLKPSAGEQQAAACRAAFAPHVAVWRADRTRERAFRGRLSWNP